jgi:hypothetical protein
MGLRTNLKYQLVQYFARSTTAFLAMSATLYKELVLRADECFWLFQGGEMTPYSPAELPLLLPRSR